jgi:hypothetical protein
MDLQVEHYERKHSKDDVITTYILCISAGYILIQLIRCLF